MKLRCTQNICFGYVSERGTSFEIGDIVEAEERPAPVRGSYITLLPKGKRPIELTKSKALECFEVVE